jgi:hypothetical protein
MPEATEFFEEFGKIPSKEFGLILAGQREGRRRSLRREYLAQEEAA